MSTRRWARVVAPVAEDPSPVVQPTAISTTIATMTTATTATGPGMSRLTIAALLVRLMKVSVDTIFESGDR